MKLPVFLLFSAAFAGFSLAAEVPANLVSEGIPDIPAALREDAGRYLEFRAAAFLGWHPVKREALISTRFADTPQLHTVAIPGGARKQITFLAEPVRGASWRPGSGDSLLFSRDTGGGEFFQLFLRNTADGKTTLLTDGKSRNTGAVWSKDGSRIAWTSTLRNGKDNDIWIMDPDKPGTAKLVAELTGGGWGVTDWSPDGTKLAVVEYLSINSSRLWLVDAATGAKELLTPDGDKPVARGAALFSEDGQNLFFTSDENGEFHQLGRMNLNDRKFHSYTAGIPWDIEGFDLSPDGKTLAFVSNEAGRSVLYYTVPRSLIDAGGHPVEAHNAPAKVTGIANGVIGALQWHQNGKDLGFALTSANSPSDVYSVEITPGPDAGQRVIGKVERWTESETGGLNAAAFVEPELVKVKSFDGLEVSGFLYRPDPAKFPGQRPVLVNIHGGPEGQSRPIFQARNNYYLDELGVALFFPNVRGSEGYGKTFLTLDNGFKREDSVKDIGAFLDWFEKDAACDPARVAVMGGSYGGYMTLACLLHHGERLRCGIDIVGISNFLTFLQNTQDYRRDLRRVEYGDERDPAMNEFLGKISPSTQADKITKPLFVVQGKNDPRVPLSEAEQMVAAVRKNGRPVWYLMAKDEGHGFAKKPNADHQFLATVLFLRQHLLD